jgi:hypothetical protein
MMEPLENFEEKPPLELPTQTRLKVKVKRLKIVGEWRWTDGKDDNCGICRTSFETCCVDCKFPGDDCPLVCWVMQKHETQPSSGLNFGKTAKLECQKKLPNHSQFLVHIPRDRIDCFLQFAPNG